MTRIVVVGDSRMGKNEFMHLATTGQAPLNIYASRTCETFTLVGAGGSRAEFIVVPGRAGDEMLAGACEGADGIMVIYKGTVYNAKRWLMRCTRGSSVSVPVMLCYHNSAFPPDRRVPEMLHQWPTAEHSCTSTLYTIGMQDCANRIVRRARANPGSPLGR